MAFLRSDSDDEQQQKQPAHSRQASLHLDQQGSLPGGSHPSRSRFFDVPSADSQPPPPPPQQQQQHQQPGTPSAGADGSVLGRKLTFDQFKAAAAGGSVNPAPPPPPEQQQQGQGHVPGKALTMAELEHQMSGGPVQPPPPPANQPPPPPGVLSLHIAAACMVVLSCDLVRCLLPAGRCPLSAPLPADGYSSQLHCMHCCTAAPLLSKVCCQLCTPLEC
jgi:hypothetical protein